jgi:hypothetical protein
MSKKRKGEDEMNEYIPLVLAIKRIRAKHPWWPETSIRDAIRDRHIPSRKASLRSRSKYFVRMTDLEAFVEKLKVAQIEPQP